MLRVSFRYEIEKMENGENIRAFQLSSGTMEFTFITFVELWILESTLGEKNKIKINKVMGVGFLLAEGIYGFYGGYFDKPKDKVMIVSATNTPWDIDSAFKRPGRFDRVIFVEPPDKEARKVIFKLKLEGKPVENVDFNAFSQATELYSGAY